MNDLKISPEQELLMKAKIKKAYLICTIIIFAVILTIQFILLLYNNDELSKQFSFASTITSIILSVIAIIMTVVSSDSINSLLHKFRDLHDEIKDTPQKINSSVKSIESVSEHFDKSEIAIREGLSKMDSNVCQISSATDDMKDILSEIKKAIVTMDAKLVTNLEEIKDGVKGALELSAPIDKKEPQTATSRKNDSFLDTCSNAALYLVYAAKLAKDSRKILNIKSLSDITLGSFGKEGSFFYWGFLQSSHSSSSIEIDYPANADNENSDDIAYFNCIISNIKPQISDNIENKLNERIKTDKMKDYKTNIEQMINKAQSIPQKEENNIDE